MSTEPSLHVFELLCSRLCHDLISPVGAVKSGLELLAEFDEDPGGEAMALITSSAESASAKLQFFRMAFGKAGSSQSLSSREAAALAAAMVVTQRTTLEWPESATPADGDAAKMVLNLVLLAADALPKGGVLQVRMGGADDAVLAEVTAASDDASLPDEAVAAAQGTAAEADLTPRTVQAYLTHLLARRLDGRVAITPEPGTGIVFGVHRGGPGT